MTSPAPVITTVVSDLGGVLTTPLWDAFVAYGEHAGIPLEAFWTALGELGARGGANPMEELECGRVSEREFTDALGAQIASQLGRDIDVSDFGEVWFSHLHANAAMLELMRELRDRGYEMALLTNNVREWERHWRTRLGIDAIFGTIVDSGFVGMRKPDPRIYALTLERLGDPDPAQLLFVDDMELNVTAAREAGWNAIQFVDNAQAVPEIEALLVTDAPRVD